VGVILRHDVVNSNVRARTPVLVYRTHRADRAGNNALPCGASWRRIPPSICCWLHRRRRRRRVSQVERFVSDKSRRKSVTSTIRQHSRRLPVRQPARLLLLSRDRSTVKIHTGSVFTHNLTRCISSPTRSINYYNATQTQWTELFFSFCSQY